MPLNDSNDPVNMIISGNLKFEFYLNPIQVYITDMLQDKKYTLIPSLNNEKPFNLLLIKEPKDETRT